MPILIKKEIIYNLSIDAEQHVEPAILYRPHYYFFTILLYHFNNMIYYDYYREFYTMASPWS